MKNIILAKHNVALPEEQEDGIYVQSYMPHDLNKSIRELKMNRIKNKKKKVPSPGESSKNISKSTHNENSKIYLMLMKGDAKMTGTGSNISSKENMKTSRQLNKEANETQLDDKSPIHIQNDDSKLTENFTFNKSLDRAKKSTSQINLQKLKVMQATTQVIPKMARSPNIDQKDSEMNVSALKTA